MLWFDRLVEGGKAVASAARQWLTISKALYCLGAVPISRLTAE